MTEFPGGSLLKRGPVAAIAIALPALGVMIGGAGWIRPHRNSGTSVAPIRDRMHLPRVMLWAWERPQDLRFIDPRATGVAFLAGTIEIRSVSPERKESAAEAESTVVMRPRLQPLLVPPGTPLMAVVRIETPNDLWRRPVRAGAKPKAGASSPSPTSLYSKAQRLRVAKIIASVAGIRGVHAVQVDYDATQGERPFYRQLIQDLRSRLPRAVPLSITALASWCIGDTWLNSLPAGAIDEAVPMLFRMGTDASNVAAFVRGGYAFRARACRTSLGVSTDEAFSQSLLKGQLKSFSGRRGPRRIYIFSSRAWSKKSVQQLVREIQKWDAESPKSR